ncbi:MAG: hypothetical protein CME64_08355 [Halobacteriovoraceae bacterium]|nr:hypothetical protein [Halobacteriovoraceae bacterium]
MFKVQLGLTAFFMSLNLFAHGISEEAKNAMISGGYLNYVWLGAEHMVTGYDHLLFLFGVIFFLRGFKDIFKFISVFTLGHSITLILATFIGISANYWLVDAVIAVSVIYKGFDNNEGFQEYFGLKRSPNLLWMVFIFGLIHGFGLSTRLQQLPLGEKGSEMLVRIISFNVGVEFGQIFALAIMLLIITQLRKHHMFQRLSRVFNGAIMVAGFMLLLMQLHGYLHTSNPDEFGFGEDNHIHHHLDMENKKTEQYQHDNL